MRDSVATVTLAPVPLKDVPIVFLLFRIRDIYAQHTESTSPGFVTQVNQSFESSDYDSLTNPFGHHPDHRTPQAAEAAQKRLTVSSNANIPAPDSSSGKQVRNFYVSHFRPFLHSHDVFPGIQRTLLLFAA